MLLQLPSTAIKCVYKNCTKFYPLSRIQTRSGSWYDNKLLLVNLTSCFIYNNIIIYLRV